jgi:ribosomal protein L32
MNVIQKSEAIKNGLRKGFQDGSSKMAHRKCYGYEVGPDGKLTVNPEEAKVVNWIFEQYLAGNSLGKIAAGLEKQGITSPTGKPRWNREAIDKLLSNEKYTGRVLLQKTVSTSAVQIENNGLMERYLYTGTHEAIITDELFMAVQQEKLSRSKEPQNHIAMKLSL